jgi:rubredoxin
MIYDPVIGDPDAGIAAGTAFTDIPDNWSCPICGATKKTFKPLEEKMTTDNK